MNATAISLPLLASTPVLRPWKSCTPNAYAMDVAEGCGAACVHCVGGHAGEKYGDTTRVEVHPNIVPRLVEELEHLAAQGRRPAVIRLGVESDPLSTAPGVREATLACMQAAFDRGVRVELHTRSAVPDDLVQLLRTHPHMGMVVAGVMAARDSAARVYEPGLLPTAGRLKSLRPLVAAGVRVHVRLEPMIPLVNDTEADLEALMSAMAKNGLGRVELGYLQLSESTARGLSRGLPRMHREMLKGLFASESWQDGPHGKRKLLPRVLREAGYERAISVARRHGLLATVCSCTEPELRGTRPCQRFLEATPSHKSSVPPVKAGVPTQKTDEVVVEQLRLFSTAGKR